MQHFSHTSQENIMVIVIFFNFVGARASARSAPTQKICFLRPLAGRPAARAPTKKQDQPSCFLS